MILDFRFPSGTHTKLRHPLSHSLPRPHSLSLSLSRSRSPSPSLSLALALELTTYTHKHRTIHTNYHSYVDYDSTETNAIRQ